MILYDIDGAIDDLEKEITKARAHVKELEGQRQRLSEVRGALAQSGRVRHAEQSPSGRGGTRMTRKQALIAYLTASGPKSRAEMVEATEIPTGTISYELNDKETFVRLGDGRWDLVANQEALRTATVERDRLLAAIKAKKKFFYGTVVAQAQRVSLRDDRLEFAFVPSQRTLARQVDQQQQWIQHLASEVAGRPIRVVVQVAESTPAASQNGPTAQD